MTIHTKYSIGDFIHFRGKKYKIISVHLYESKNKHTERYYLGNQLWVTLKFEQK